MPVESPVVDKKLWKQVRGVMLSVRSKPSVLPNRVGALSGLEKDPDEVTIVSLVDGDIIKARKDMNFQETTHEEREPDYADGILVDANAPIKDWPLLLYRSAHEYRDMCQNGYSYDVAKKRAQDGERELRLAEFRDEGGKA